MKVILYARVSTDDKEQDPERQFLKCRQYCDLHNHEVIVEIKDYYTGDSDPFSRPEGCKMLNYNPEGIIVFSMDRFSRQHPIKVIQLMNNLKNQGIKLVSITEPAFNMESEFSEIIIYIMGWFNNYFLAKLKRDIKSGQEKARKEGKHIGRLKAEFNKLRAFELLFNEKKSQRVVSKDIGVSLATLNRFKRVCEKDGGFFINKQFVPLTGVSETEKQQGEP